MKVFKFLSRLIPKFDLSKTEDKLKLFILVNGLVLFIGVFSVAALKLTSTPQFCAICHEMRPEYVTWAATSHNKVACVKCHIEPGIVNLIKHKMGAMKQLYQHVTKTYHRPIEMPHEIEDYICEQCHSQNRVVNASGDLIIPHEKHKIQEVPCVRCHSGVAHGKIAEREVTAEGDFSEWTLALGKKEAAPKYTRPAMKTCMTCHKERQVTTDCAA
ncbi:cytochrome c3 family protein, partial [Calderihabitans maritimus]